MLIFQKRYIPVSIFCTFLLADFRTFLFADYKIQVNKQQSDPTGIFLGLGLLCTSVGIYAATRGEDLTPLILIGGGFGFVGFITSLGPQPWQNKNPD